MDTLRGNYADRADEADELTTYDTGAGDDGRDDLPSVVDGDERRMQVRAYNHWAGLLENRNFPAIDDLEPGGLPDFGPYSVLLDFSAGIENPGIAYLGDKLAHECGASEGMATLADVPPRSLLSRITDHYMQILANQAPIGFEAEFVNQRGATILYRGILLPYSSDDETIDFIYGVINWKEMADQRTADALLLEIGQALDDSEAQEEVAPRKDDTPLTDWADGPAADLGAAPADDEDEDEDVLDLIEVAEADSIDDLDELDELDDADEIDDEPVAEAPAEIARPRFGSLLNLSYSSTRNDDSDDEGNEDEHRFPIGVSILPVAEPVAEIHVPEIAPDEMGLGDWLAAARELADEVRQGEERTRAALYEAIGRAYDFSLAAAREPEAFAELLADAGLAAQERAPMTPVVKLVFGADYDKTRLTEYAAALAHAHRIGLEQGALGEYLTRAEGGLKGVVQAERRLRRADAGLPVDAAGAPRAATVKKLRAAATQGFDAIPAEGPEFALVMLRRLPGGAVVVVGEVPDDVTLVERAAKKLLG